MYYEKVNLTLPEIQLVARVECDAIDCSLEVIELELLSLELFDTANCKFYIDFNAKLKIDMTIDGHDESIIINAEEFRLSSVDTIGDPILDFDFEESTIDKDELYRRLDGEEMNVRFYTIAK